MVKNYAETGKIHVQLLSQAWGVRKCALWLHLRQCSHVFRTQIMIHYLEYIRKEPYFLWPTPQLVNISNKCLPCSKYSLLLHFMLLGGLAQCGLSSMVSCLNVYKHTVYGEVMSYGHIYSLLPPPLLQLLRLLGNIYRISLAPWESHTCLTRF